MLKNYNKYAVLKVFFDFPTENLRLREISRLSDVPPKSVMNYLALLEKESLIKKVIKKNIPTYVAERDNEKFIAYKKISIFFELNETGLIDTLWESLSPNAIILFGSFAKGESTENSDIDIFVNGKEKNIDLTKFEKKLNKKINLFFENRFEKLSSELKNNILNGILLKGYLEVF